MRTGWVTIPCLCSLLLVAASQRMAVAQLPEDEAAKEGIEILRELVNQNNFKQLGFDTLAEAKTGLLKRGPSLLVFWVGLDQLKVFQPGSDPAKLLFDAKMITYPVMLGPAVKSSLTVTQTQSSGNPWRATRWGSAKLIRLLQQYRRSSSDFVVWIPALNLHFLGDRAGGQFMMTALANYPGLKLDAGVALPAQAVFSRLLPEAKAHDGGAR